MNLLKPSSIFSRFRYLAFLFYACYLAAFVFKDTLWGLHHYTFLSAFGATLVVVSSFILIALPPRAFVRSWRILQNNYAALSVSSNFTPIGISVIATFCFYAFPMVQSLYGDAEFFQERLGARTTTFELKYLYHLFTPNFLDPKTGNLTVLSAVRLLSYYSGATHEMVFKVLSAICGGAYVFLWIRFTQRYLTSITMQVVLIILGLFAPFVQFFFGYQEIYAPIIWAMMIYLTTLLSFLEDPNRRRFILFSVALFACLKLHGSNLLLLPSFILAILYAFSERNPYFQRFLTWRVLMFGFMVPIFAAGLYLYFVKFADHIDPRFLGPEVDIYERLFLPIQAPAAPLDRYTLLHFNHLLDFLNLPFQWSAGSAFLIIGVLIFCRSDVRYQAIEFKVLAITLILYLVLFFAYNPLMSMPIDIDLFSLPATVLLGLGLIIARQLEGRYDFTFLIGPVLGLSLFSMCIYFVNANRDSLSHRLEHVGRHVFKTYWIRSAGDIHAGINLVKEDSSQYISRYLETATLLAPYAEPSGDVEYANLLWQIGKYFRTREKDYSKALEYHTAARRFDDQLAANYIGLVEANYFLEHYDAAFEFGKKLIELEYPTLKRAYRIAIDCGIQAQRHTDLLKITEAYLQQWPDDDIKSLYSELSSMKLSNE